MIAVQGPNARRKAADLLPPAQQPAVLELKPFSGAAFGSWFIARTGYTGEDGFEIMLPAADAADAWRRLLDRGVKPAGLGARDTLRLEAGMNLYGNDMDEQHHPLESGLSWSVAFEPAEREFIGRAALLTARLEGCDRLVGLLLEERGVLRSHQKVLAAGLDGEGMVTSGTFSPTLNRSIALARVPQATGAAVTVEIRGRMHAARVVKPPFVRHGKAMIEI
jgi:aminomethyltransferase